jgi:polyisoprenoid-binding protein YceI
MVGRRAVAVGLALLLPVCAAAAHRPTPPSPPPARSLLEGVELYSVDAPHSQVSFIVPWMGISKVRGSFQDFLGSIAFDSLDLTRSSVTVIIQAKSINTGFEMRDKDLRGHEFFAADTFPTIVFSSREVAKTGDGYLLRGPLTIHGITREIEIPFVFNGHIKDAGGDDRIGFEGHLTLKRKDYGIVGPARFNVLLDKGIIIGEDVDIPLAVEGWKPAPHDTLRDPVADSLFRVVLKSGAPAMVQQFRALRSATPDSLMAAMEGPLNGLGYQLLSLQRTTDAIAIFQLEAESYPRHAFGYVGLGNTYAVAGERELATQTLEKATAINPQASRALEILKRLRLPN